MLISGIVAEYNPFHNGHIYHIEQTKKITNCDLLIAVMSPNFSQRGQVTIADKWQRTAAALDNGIDLVVELPFIYATQYADIFAGESINILKKLNINYLSFGSETGNLEELKEIAELPVNVAYLKELLRNGESYPKAYGLLNDSIYPNDALAVQYLRALKGSNIEALAIKRIGSYNDIKLDHICSGKAIRKAIELKEDISIATPMNIKNPLYNKYFYPYLRTLLLTAPRKLLAGIFLVNEGIEKLFKQQANLHDDYESFINACISKRYTRSRIERTLLQIMLLNKKDDINNLARPCYIKVLGFNTKGREYLHQIKNKTKIITRFAQMPKNMKIIEEKAAYLYASILDENERKSFLKRELMGPIIKE